MSSIPQILLDNMNHEAILLNPSVEQSIKDDIVIAAFSCLSLNSISTVFQRYLYSLITLIAKKDIRVLCSTKIIEVFSNTLYGVVENQKDISIKKHSFACILAAKILFTMYRATEEWPTRFAIAWVYDQLRHKFWSEHPSTQEFVNDIKSAFFINIPGSSCRFRERNNIDEVWSVTEKEIESQIDKGLDLKILGPLLIQLVQIPKIRLLAVQQLEKWIHHSTFGTNFINTFLPELIQHVYSDSEIDINIVNKLSLLKMKQNMQKFYTECITKLASNNAAYSHYILRNILINELQSTSIPNSLGILILQSIHSFAPEVTARIIAGFLQELSYDPIYEPNLLKFAKRIAKFLGSSFNLIPFAEELLIIAELSNYSKEIREYYVNKIVEILSTFSLTIAVELNPFPFQYNQDKQLISAQVSSNEQQSLLLDINMKMMLSKISNLATNWLFNISSNYITDLQPECIYRLLSQALFLNTQIDSLLEIKKSTDLWIAYLPCEEETLLALIQASNGYLCILRQNFFTIIPDLIIRAAHLQTIIEEKGISRDQFHCLRIYSPELLKNIYLSCSYVPIFPQEVKLPTLFVWLREYFWKATTISIILSAFNCDTLGAYIWSIPTLKYLVSIIISDDLKSIDSKYPGSNLLPNEKEIVEHYCLEMKNLYDSLGLEHNFFQSNSIEKWSQSLTIPDENSEIRYPPLETIQELIQLNNTLKLGQHFRECRNPDLLLQLIHDKGSSSLNWLSHILSREPQVLNALPVSLLCEILLHSVDKVSRFSNTEELIEQIAKQLTQRIQFNPNDSFLIIEYYFLKLIDQVSESIQNNAKYCLDIIVGPLVERFTGNVSWIYYLPNLISLHNDHSRNLISQTFSTYLHIGNDEEVIRAMIDFLLQNGIISQQQLSLEISYLFNNKPNIVRKIDWKANNFKVLELLISCFYYSFEEYKKLSITNNSSYINGDLSSVKLGESFIFVHKSFLEGYLHILGIAEKYNRLSGNEINILLQLLDENTAYEDGSNIVNFEMAKIFLQSKNDMILKKSIRALKEFPHIILLDLLSRLPFNAIPQTLLDYFESMNNNQLKEIISKLSPHQAGIFLSSINILTAISPNLFENFKRYIDNSESKTTSILLQGVQIEDKNVSSLDFEPTIKNFSDLSMINMKDMDEFLLSTLGDQNLSNINSTLTIDSSLKDHWKQIHTEAITRILSNENNYSENINLIDSHWINTCPLIKSFYIYSEENKNNISKKSLKNILDDIWSYICDKSTSNEQQTIHLILETIFHKLPLNYEFEKLFFQFLMSKFSPDDLISDLIKTARSCPKHRRNSIFDCIASQYPSMNHSLILEELFKKNNSPHTQVEETFNFKKASNLIVKNGSYSLFLKISDMLLDKSFDHKKVLDIIILIRKNIYSDYKCETFDQYFPQWKIEYAQNMTLTIIDSLKQIILNRNTSEHPITLFLRKSQNSKHLSLLFEACRNSNFLKETVKLCLEGENASDNLHKDTCQCISTWIYTCFPQSVVEICPSINHILVDPTLTSSLDETIHFLCLSIRTRQSDQFLFHYFRMLCCSYPNLILSRIKQIESLLEFGYSTSIERFVEKQSNITFENVIIILHCLIPTLLSQTENKYAWNEIINIIKKYFMILKRIPSSQYSVFENLLVQFVDFLLMIKKSSLNSINEIINENMYSLSKIMTECTIPTLKERISKLTFEQVGELRDEDDYNSNFNDQTFHNLAIIQTFQYKNPQHSYNSVEINIHNSNLLSSLLKLSEEISPSFQNLKIAIPSLFRLCTVDDAEVRNQAYNLLYLYICSDPLGNDEIIPKLLSLFHYPDMDVRRHAITSSQDFAPFAGQYTNALFEALFQAQSDGLTSLCTILQRIYPVIQN